MTSHDGDAAHDGAAVHHRIAEQMAVELGRRGDVEAVLLGGSVGRKDLVDRLERLGPDLRVTRRLLSNSYTRAGDLSC